MNGTTIGLLVGAGLGIVLLVFGFWGFLLVVIAAGVGALVGRILDGTLDIRSLLDALRGRRSS